MAKSKWKTRGIDTANYGSSEIELNEMVDWINGKVEKGKEALAGKATGKEKKVCCLAAGNCVEKEVLEGQGSKNVGFSPCSGDSKSRGLQIAHIARADKKSLGIVEEDDLEDSISKTLGDEDTMEEVKKNDGGKQDLKNNRSTNLGIKFDLWNKKKVGERVKIEEEDVKKVEKCWGFGLVGYIAGMNPGKAAILKCCNSWKVKFKVFFHGSGWIIFKFESEADRDKVLENGPYRVYGKLLLLKVLREMFAFNEEEISKVPVWVKFPNLPIGLWNKSALGKIASNIGKPIQSDNLTQTMQALSYARLLVEVDIAKEARYEIEMDLPNGDSMVQKVVYEFLPRFCSKCKCIGHSTNVCGGRIGVKRKQVEKSPMMVGSADVIQASTPLGHVVYKDAASVLAHAAADRPASQTPSRPASPAPPRSASSPHWPVVSNSVCPDPSSAQGPPLSPALQQIPPISLPTLSSSHTDHIFIESAANALRKGPLIHFPPIFLPNQSSMLSDQAITESAAKAAPSQEISNAVLELKELEGYQCEKVKERRKKKKDKGIRMHFGGSRLMFKMYGARPYPEDKSDIYRYLKHFETDWIHAGKHLIRWPKWLEKMGVV